MLRAGLRLGQLRFRLARLREQRLQIGDLLREAGSIKIEAERTGQASITVADQEGRGADALAVWGNKIVIGDEILSSFERMT